MIVIRNSYDRGAHTTQHGASCGAAEGQVNRLISVRPGIIDDDNSERLARVARTKGERAGGGAVFAGSLRCAITGGVLNGDGAVATAGACDGNGRAAATLRDAVSSGIELQLPEVGLGNRQHCVRGTEASAAAWIA